MAHVKQTRFLANTLDIPGLEVRPTWHSECSAAATDLQKEVRKRESTSKSLAKTFRMLNVFPEIAQHFSYT